MRIPRVQFTVRQMMIAVAVVALVAGADRLARRRAYFLMRAEVEADRAYDYATGHACLKEEYDKPGMYPKLHAHYAALAQKYRLAAARPYLPVAPDPPMPEP
jgi:hypothetical protein